jgi:hypothetical protein
VHTVAIGHVNVFAFWDGGGHKGSALSEKEEKRCNCSTIKKHSCSGSFYAVNTEKQSKKRAKSACPVARLYKSAKKNTVFKGVLAGLGRQSCLSSYQKYMDFAEALGLEKAR